MMVSTMWLELLFLALAYATDVSSGQNTEFAQVVIRAQCHTRCIKKHGIVHKFQSKWFIYDFYKPQLDCPQSNRICSSCIQPCRYVFESVDQCRSDCTNLACFDSCDFIYQLRLRYLQNGVLQQSNSSVDLGPVLVTCQEKSRNSTVLYLKWTVKQTWSSLAKSASTSSLAFIVQIRKQEESRITPWKAFMVRYGWIPVVITSNAQYQFRVTALFQNGIAGTPKTTPWIRPETDQMELHRPTDLRVIRQHVIENQVYVLIAWKPPEENVCRYNMALLPDKANVAPEEINIEPLPEFKYNCGPLTYNSTYRLELSSCDSDQHCSNETASTTFHTLPCLNATGFNYKLCPPDPVLDVQIKQLELVDNHADDNVSCTTSVQVRWKPLLYTLHDSPIEYYTISWNKQPMLYQSLIQAPHSDSVRVASNLTVCTIGGFEMNVVYEVAIVAVSRGGPSNPTSTQVSIKGNRIACGSKLGELFEEGVQVKERLSWYATITIPSIVVVLIVLGLLAGILYKRYTGSCRMDSHFAENNPLRTNQFASRMSPNPIYFGVQQIPSSDDANSGNQTTADKYEIDFRKLILTHELGQGAFGRVLKGKLHEAPKWLKLTDLPLTVAVKLLKAFPKEEDRRELLKEISMMKGLGRHTNIVSIVGSCTSGPQICLVMDYCPYGDLRRYLRMLREKYAPTLNLKVSSGRSRCYSSRSTSGSVDHSSGLGSSSSSRSWKNSTSDTNSGNQRISTASSLYLDKRRFGSCTSQNDSDNSSSDGEISERKLLSYARQIVSGMEYLSQKKFVHRDLAARNVLVCEHNVVKISDFGLTRDIYEDSIYQKHSTGKLPIKWMSIEAIFDQVYTSQSDVWSFGVVLWEILTLGGSPYPGIHTRELYGLLKQGYRMEKPDNCDQSLYELMLRCWLPCSTDRPTFTQLRHTLDEMLEKILGENCNYISLDIHNNTADYPQPSSSSSAEDSSKNGERERWLDLHLDWDDQSQTDKNAGHGIRRPLTHSSSNDVGRPLLSSVSESDEVFLPDTGSECARRSDLNLSEVNQRTDVRDGSLVVLSTPLNAAIQRIWKSAASLLSQSDKRIGGETELSKTFHMCNVSNHRTSVLQ